MNQESKYYKLLEEFKEKSKEAIEEGYQNIVVICCHELFRNLAPYDSFIKKEQYLKEEPLDNIIEVLLNQITLLEFYKKSIHPYPFISENSFEIESLKNVEKRTPEVYNTLWKQFDKETMVNESVALLKKQFNNQVNLEYLKGKKVLDMGCGSGRYTIALSKLGAKHVIGFDLGEKAISRARDLVQKLELDNISFQVGNFHQLPFENESFDFVYANGTLHHSTSIKKGLEEIKRILKPQGKAWLFLYGKGGIFWNTRLALREIMQLIPIEFSNIVMRSISIPNNLFSFIDSAYVPIETHSSKEECEELFRALDLDFKKIIGGRPYDLDFALQQEIADKEVMYGSGENRYIVSKEKI